MLLAKAPDIFCISSELLVKFPRSLGKYCIDITQQTLEKLYQGKERLEAKLIVWGTDPVIYVYPHNAAEFFKHHNSLLSFYISSLLRNNSINNHILFHYCSRFSTLFIIGKINTFV